MSQKTAKLLRRSLKKAQGELAEDLKTWLRDLPLVDRVVLSFRIIFKQKW